MSQDRDSSEPNENATLDGLAESLANPHSLAWNPVSPSTMIVVDGNRLKLLSIEWDLCNARAMSPLLLVCLILFQLSGTSVGQTLKERLKPIIDAHAGEVTVAIKNLTTGEAYEHEATKVMPTASLIKFPILVELYRQMEEGILPTSRMVTLTQEEMVPGSGILTQHFQRDNHSHRRCRSIDDHLF